MSSPAKKRKLNSNQKEVVPSRGLEYFFAKQRQTGSASASRPADAISGDAAIPSEELTDEQLARKIQAEWNRGPEGRDVARADESSEHGSESRAITPPPASSAVTSPTASAQGEASTKTLSLQSVAAADGHFSTSLPLDESPLSFEPSQYIPQLKAHWATDGGDASYALLTRCFVLVNGTRSRIKIVDTLVNCLRVLIEGDPSSLLPMVCSPKLPSLQIPD